MVDVGKDAMYAQERQEAIAALVGERGRASVTELAGAFAVTTETVRRDLDALERCGLLRRVHGGAVSSAVLATTREHTLAERDVARGEQKDRIAKAALSLLPGSHGTLLIDGGSTTARFAARLPTDVELTVVTNSVPVAARIAGVSGLRLELLGGRVRRTTQACVGESTVQALAALHLDVAFIGANGISVDGGLTTPDSHEAAVKRAMVAAARRVVALVDSSKANRDHLISFARLDEVDVLVTDDEFPSDLLGPIEALGVEVLIG